MTETRFLAILCGLAALFGWGLYTIYLHDVARQASLERDAAVSARQLAEQTTQIVERYHEKETVIRETAAPAIQAIEEAQGADEPIPPDVRDRWAVGLSLLRDQAASPDNHDPKPAE